jgi:hypothetical protein
MKMVYFKYKEKIYNDAGYTFRFRYRINAYIGNWCHKLVERGSVRRSNHANKTRNRCHSLSTPASKPQSHPM